MWIDKQCNICGADIAFQERHINCHYFNCCQKCNKKHHVLEKISWFLERIVNEANEKEDL